MGVPLFDRSSIPACGQGVLISEDVDGCKVSAVNTGVPHAVVFVEDMDFDIMNAAPFIRHNSLFPEGANVNFVKVGQPLEIRTFERGVEGETLSCGTGSVAAASVARRLGLVDDEVIVQTKGGPLLISFEEGKAFMEGPAVTVCSGEISEEYLWNISMEV
jgi:diaminopimelate epimerase